MSVRFSWQQVAPDLFAVVDKQRFPEWATNETYSSAYDAERIACDLEQGRITPSSSNDVPLTTKLSFTPTPVTTHWDNVSGRFYSEYPRRDAAPRRIIHLRDTYRNAGHVHAVRRARAEWGVQPRKASTIDATGSTPSKEDKWYGLRAELVDLVMAKVGVEKNKSIEWHDAWETVVPSVLATDPQKEWYREAAEDGNNGWQRYYFGRDLRARQKRLKVSNR